MHRISRDELRMRLAIALTLYKRSEKRVMGIDTERKLNQVVDDLVGRIMGYPDNENVILKPSAVTTRDGERQGVWDQDEPHPVSILERNNITFKS